MGEVEEVLLLGPLILTLDETWDGRPVPGAEVVRLALLPAPGGLAVEVDAPFYGEPAPPSATSPSWNLWTYETAFLFLVQEGSDPGIPRYAELQMTPHGEARLHRFRGRRHYQERGFVPPYRSTIWADRWEGHCFLAARRLPEPPYWGNAFSLRGPPGRRRCLAYFPIPARVPDFHRVTMYPRLGL